MSFKIYKILIYLISPFIIIFFFLRVLQGKEDKNRFLEKLSIFSIKKKSKKNMVWFHACSVGEAKSIYNLIKKFLANDFQVLITTNTFLSALDIKKNFSNTIIHQYLPLDLSYFNNRFLNYWNPDIAIIVESELWPNLIYNVKSKKIPLCWIQARVSDKSFKNWLVFKSFFISVLKRFEFIVSQSNVEKKKLVNIGIKVKSVINLKLSSSKPNYDRFEKNKIKKKIPNKNILTIISSHEGEEEIILNTFYNLQKKFNNLLLIIQPRHPSRKNKILNKIKKLQLNVKQRSLREYPNKNTQVFLFDTFGETGLVISLSDIVILGGTFAPIGGHNIIEPAQFKKCIISGPYFDKISDTFLQFKKNNAVMLANTNNLKNIVNSLLTNKDKKNLLEKNAYKLTLNYNDNINTIFKKIIQLVK